MTFAVAVEKPDWSLSDVAFRIGVSKTALYRHFRNRAEIETLMDEQLVEDIVMLVETSGTSSISLRADAMAFFRARQGYLIHLMIRTSEDRNFANDLTKKLIAKSPRASAFFDRYESFLEITVIKNWISILIASFPIPNAERIQDGLLDTLENGIPALRLPDDARLDELERIAEIETGETGERNRLFAAIALSIQEHGVKGTTIETIAEKMGTAKSSLYFYSPNKVEMLSGLLNHETKTLDALSDSRAEQGTTLAEQLYVVMMTHANYIIANKNLVPVFNWIRYEMMREHPKAPSPPDCTGHAMDTYRFRELFPVDEKAGKLYAMLTLKWASMLSISCTVRGYETGSDAQTIRKNVRDMFRSMINGDAREFKALRERR